jgi:hypothetical protein
MVSRSMLEYCGGSKTNEDSVSFRNPPFQSSLSWYIYLNRHTYVYICIHLCPYIHIFTYINIHIYRHIFIHIYIYTHTYSYIYMHAYVCLSGVVAAPLIASAFALIDFQKPTPRSPWESLTTPNISCLPRVKPPHTPSLSLSEV